MTRKKRSVPVVDIQRRRSTPSSSSPDPTDSEVEARQPTPEPQPNPEPQAVEAQPIATPNDTAVEIVYADGACRGNGRPGAVAGIGVWWSPGDPR